MKGEAAKAPGVYREVTLAAMLLGVGQGVLMTAAFTYIGLKLGFGISGSSIAAILGFALLRGVGRGVLKVRGAGSILETNINQTVASGVNTASSGVVFTLPALIMLGHEYSVWVVLLAATAGSFMGVILIIPLRKQMIEVERLRFPSGVAVATILRTPGAGIKKGALLGIGFGVALVITLLGQLGVFPEDIPIGPWVASAFDVAPEGALSLSLLGTTFYLSMANIGAGMLSGKGGVPFALGGILAWWLVGPIAVAAGFTAPGLAGDELVSSVYGQLIRPTGIGVLIGGALAGVVVSLPALRGALRSLSAAARVGRSEGGGSEELSPRLLGVGLAASVLALVFVTWVATRGQAMHPVQVLGAALVGALWIALAGLIVAQATGATDISPLSGLALIAVTLMLAVTSGNVVLAVTIGVAVCIATGQCADMMTDLKTGHLIGAVPKRQQYAQLVVAWVGPGIAIGTTLLLWQAGPGGSGGFGPDSVACVEKTADCLPAPQAAVLKGLIEGVVSGTAPVDKYLSGAGIGAALAAFPVGGLGVLVGLAMYLPFSITLSYGFGCLVAILLERRWGRRFTADKVVPLAAGFIVGEALTALGYTLVKMLGGAG